MLRYAKYAVPLILKAPRRSPVKTLAGLAVSYLLFVVGVIFLMTAVFIWIATNYGADTAFLTLGLLLIACGGVIKLFARNRRVLKAPLPSNVARDPLAQYIPPSVRENPTIRKLIVQISENPVAATATAVTLGMLISNELFEES